MAPSVTHHPAVVIYRPRLGPYSTRTAFHSGPGGTHSPSGTSSVRGPYAPASALVLAPAGAQCAEWCAPFRRARDGAAGAQGTQSGTQAPRAPEMRTGAVPGLRSLPPPHANPHANRRRVAHLQPILARPPGPGFNSVSGLRARNLKPAGPGFQWFPSPRGWDWKSSARWLGSARKQPGAAAWSRPRNEPG